MVFIYLMLAIYLLFSIYVEYKLIKHKSYEKTQKIAQSFVIWLLPIISAILVNWLLKYNKPTGTHRNKIPSWKRLIKYEDNGFY